MIQPVARDAAEQVRTRDVADVVGEALAEPLGCRIAFHARSVAQRGARSNGRLRVGCAGGTLRLMGQARLVRGGACGSACRRCPGTNWMHSHHALQEQGLRAAVLIVRDADEAYADMQDLVVLLDDCPLRDPAGILVDSQG